MDRKKQKARINTILRGCVVSLGEDPGERQPAVTVGRFFILRDPEGSMTEDSAGDSDGSGCWDGGTLSVTGCERCPALVDSRSRIVDGVGPADADLLFVGEAPGVTEDEQGEPFVGRSGDVLNEGLRAVGIDRAADSARCS